MIDTIATSPLSQDAQVNSSNTVQANSSSELSNLLDLNINSNNTTLHQVEGIPTPSILKLENEKFLLPSTPPLAGTKIPINTSTLPLSAESDTSPSSTAMECSERLLSNNLIQFLPSITSVSSIVSNLSSTSFPLIKPQPPPSPDQMKPHSPLSPQSPQSPDSPISPSSGSNRSHSHSPNFSMSTITLSPSLTVTCFRRGGPDAAKGPLFVVREFDAKVIRSSNAYFPTTPLPPTSEQAFRASIRQAMLNMNLHAESATKSEIRVLKAQGILGKRAPSCSLLGAEGMIRLLSTFGKTECANQLQIAMSKEGTVLSDISPLRPARIPAKNSTFIFSPRDDVNMEPKYRVKAVKQEKKKKRKMSGPPIASPATGPEPPPSGLDALLCALEAGTSTSSSVGSMTSMSLSSSMSSSNNHIMSNTIINGLLSGSISSLPTSPQTIAPHTLSAFSQTRPHLVPVVPLAPPHYSSSSPQLLQPATSLTFLHQPVALRAPVPVGWSPSNSYTATLVTQPTNFTFNNNARPPAFIVPTRSSSSSPLSSPTPNSPYQSTPTSPTTSPLTLPHLGRSLSTDEQKKEREAITERIMNWRVNSKPVLTSTSTFVNASMMRNNPTLTSPTNMNATSNATPGTIFVVNENTPQMVV